MLQVQNSSVTTFNNTEFGDLRIHQSENGKAWFCLNDVMKSLGLTHITELRKRLPEKGCSRIAVLTNGGNQQMIFIDEPNLYRCIFQSRKAEAEHFQNWVFEEVLPTIRKEGGYISTHQDDTPELIMARALQVAQLTIEKNQLQLQALEGENELLTAENKTLAPKAQYTDEVLQSTTTFTLTQVAKSLGFRSVNTFTKALQEKGILYRQSGQWMPRACFAGKGYFATRTARYFRSDGSTASSLSTVITEKGRAYLNQIFNNTTSNNKNN